MEILNYRNAREIQVNYRKELTISSVKENCDKDKKVPEFYAMLSLIMTLAQGYNSKYINGEVPTQEKFFA